MQLFKFFEIALVVLTLGSGLVLLFDRLYWRKRRLARAGLLDDGSEPVLVDWSRSFFPVLAVVLVVRSFVADAGPSEAPDHPSRARPGGG